MVTSKKKKSPKKLIHLFCSLFLFLKKQKHKEKQEHNNLFPNARLPKCQQHKPREADLTRHP